MNDKKYIVTCDGKEVEVTEEIYKLCVTEPESERRLIRKKKFGRIDVDEKNEKVTFILCREDSVERLLEIGVEIEDTNDSIAALETAVTVNQALAQLTEKERYIIKALFFDGRNERDLADEFGISQKNVHKHKDKILAKLNKYLKNH
ncbi:MAG: sigma-70 family RNA polymerase sigma factor [Ruminiclostridium sp.]|nr:sigma-70 family RNA polymerase sigma factor [Ruminiclostridium sp.]